MATSLTSLASSSRLAIPLPITQYDITHAELVQILEENRTPAKEPSQPRAQLEVDITTADLDRILEENRTPPAKRRSRPELQSLHFPGHPSFNTFNPLVSPATSRDICALVEAATGGLALGGMELGLGDSDGGWAGAGTSGYNIGAGVETTAADSSALLGALDILLRHNQHGNISSKHKSAILSLCDIGRLACCSKAVSEVVGDAPLWRQLFDRAAKSGRSRTYGAPKFVQGYAKSTVCGEKQLLSCFADPSDDVMDAVGWKKAAACLLSKKCVGCDELCALANPITMQRLCAECSKVNPSAYLINKTNARIYFCLSDSDLRPLRKATYENKTPNKKSCTSTLYLLSDVQVVAFKKYGNADGLAAEIGKRRTTALERYERSQSTSKPQKKRPKIERMPDRPGEGESLQKLVLSGSGLPIGTCADLQSCIMYQSVCCRHEQCSAMGSVEDIRLHEKLVHNKFG